MQRLVHGALSAEDVVLDRKHFGHEKMLPPFSQDKVILKS